MANKNSSMKNYGNDIIKKRFLSVFHVLKRCYSTFNCHNDVQQH